MDSLPSTQVLPKFLSRFAPVVPLVGRESPWLNSALWSDACNSLSLLSLSWAAVRLVHHSFMLLLFGVFCVNLQQKYSGGNMDISEGHQLVPFAALIAVGLSWQSFHRFLSCIFSLHISLVNLPFLVPRLQLEWQGFVLCKFKIEYEHLNSPELIFLPAALTG